MRKIPTFFWEYKGQNLPTIDLDAYRLVIGGEVRNPMSLSLQELGALLPVVEAQKRFYCVNGWSLEAKWQGYRLSSLIEKCETNLDALYLRATSLGGYEDTTEIGTLLEGDAMLVTHMNGEVLLPERGKPIRLMIFNMYQFKGVKSLGRIDIVKEYKPGTWQKVGYTSATIQPYPHLAIDLNKDVMPSDAVLASSRKTENL